MNKEYILERVKAVLQNSTKNNNEDVILVVDTNLGLDHARKIGEKYKTYYAIAHCEPYPKLENTISGYGFNEIIKISDFGKGLESGANVVIFIDSGFGYLADYLRKSGYYVIGADGKSERLELDRVYVRQVLQNLGVDVPPARVVKGIDGVIQAIKEAKGKVFIKISRVRGSVETFGTDDPYEAEIILSSGGFKIFGDSATFVVEDELDGVEIGVDTWFDGKEFVPIVAETIEFKGSGNATKFVLYDNSIWKDVLEKIKPFLAKNGYVGMFCLEGFFDGETIYVTDVTPRFPFICSQAYPKVIKNYPEFLVSLAKGAPVLPEIVAKYSVQVGVYTDDPNTWRVIDYSGDKSEFEKWIGFRRVAKKNGKYWFVPGDYVVAVAVSADNDLSKALLDTARRADNVSAPNIYHTGYNLINYIGETLEKAASYGYYF